MQLCGDAHLSNFGLFAAPDRSVIFDVNDFDETHPGPFEWDVKRLATSFVLAARDNGLPRKVGLAAAEAAAASYRQSMAAFAGKGELEIWYDRIDASGAVSAVRDLPGGKGRLGAKDEAKVEANVRGAVAKARLRDAWSAIAKITEVVDGHRRFRDQPPLLTRLELGHDAAAIVNSVFREYRATLQDDRQELLKRYEIIDMGHKVVGVGSVGLLAFVLLLRGRDEDDLIVLQVKQAQASVLEAYTRKSPFTKHGHRVVTGQRLMQAASDSFLGWIDGPGGRSYLRPAAEGHEVVPGPGIAERASSCPGSRRSAATRSPGRTPGPGTRSRSRRTWGRGRRSTRRSGRSPRPTPTSPSRTTRSSCRPSPRGG